MKNKNFLLTSICIILASFFTSLFAYDNIASTGHFLEVKDTTPVTITGRRPNTFPLEKNPTPENFEFYSQLNGINKRTNLYYSYFGEDSTDVNAGIVRNYIKNDTSLITEIGITLSGDSLFIDNVFVSIVSNPENVAEFVTAINNNIENVRSIVQTISGDVFSVAILWDSIFANTSACSDIGNCLLQNTDFIEEFANNTTFITALISNPDFFYTMVYEIQYDILNNNNPYTTNVYLYDTSGTKIDSVTGVTVYGDSLFSQLIGAYGGPLGISAPDKVISWPNNYSKSVGFEQGKGLKITSVFTPAPSPPIFGKWLPAQGIELTFEIDTQTIGTRHYIDSLFATGIPDSLGNLYNSNGRLTENRFVYGDSKNLTWDSINIERIKNIFAQIVTGLHDGGHGFLSDIPGRSIWYAAASDGTVYDIRLSTESDGIYVKRRPLGSKENYYIFSGATTLFLDAVQGWREMPVYVDNIANPDFRQDSIRYLFGLWNKTGSGKGRMILIDKNTISGGGGIFTFYNSNGSITGNQRLVTLTDTTELSYNFGLSAGFFNLTPQRGGGLGTWFADNSANFNIYYAPGDYYRIFGGSGSKEWFAVDPTGGGTGFSAFPYLTSEALTTSTTGLYGILGIDNTTGRIRPVSFSGLFGDKNVLYTSATGTTAALTGGASGVKIETSYTGSFISSLNGYFLTKVSTNGVGLVFNTASGNAIPKVVMLTQGEISNDISYNETIGSGRVNGSAKFMREFTYKKTTPTSGTTFRSQISAGGAPVTTISFVKEFNVIYRVGTVWYSVPQGTTTWGIDSVSLPSSLDFFFNPGSLTVDEIFVTIKYYE